MNNSIGRILAIFVLVWATISSAQTVELGGVSNDGGASFDFGTDNQKVAQRFTGLTASISKVSVKVFKTGSPTDNIIIEIRQDSPDGVLLANGTVPAVGSVSGPISDLTVPAFVVSSTRNYYVVYSRSGSPDNHNFFRVVRGTSGSVYGGVISGEFSFYRADTGWGSSNLANSFIVSLWGTPVSLGQVTMSPTSLGFGDVNVGQTAQLPIRIKNTGTATLTVNSVASDNGAFTFLPAIPPSVNVNVGDSTTVTVGFTPTATGSVSGNITITHNGVNSPTLVAVTGSGVASGGGGSSGSGVIVIGPVTFSSTSFDVGSANVGASSSRTMYLRNPDTLAVVVTNISTTTSEFVVTPISGTIPTGDSLLVTLTFNPSSSGSKTATLVANYAAGSASSVLTAVGGSGSPSPVPVLTVSSANFFLDSTIVGESKTSVLTVQNTGASNLFITNMSIGGSDVLSFTLTSPSAATVGSGEVYQIPIMFAPRSLGRKTGALNINHNGSGGTSTIYLFGVGKEAPAQAPPVVRLSTSTKTSSPPMDLIVVNDNIGGLVSFQQWQIVELSDQKKELPWSSVFLTNHNAYENILKYRITKEGAYIVRLTLEGPGGADTQDLADTIWVTTKDPKASISNEVVAFAPVEFRKGSSTSKVSIANTGEVGLNVTRVDISGLDSTDFLVLTDPNFVVSPNSSKDIWFEFKPVKSIGDKQSYAYIYFIGPDSPVRVKLSSTATDPPWGPTSIVDFSASNREGVDVDSLEVHFIHRLEGVRYERVTTYFGDGDSSNVSDPVHIYRGVGSYSPSLVVTLVGGEKVTPRTKEDYVKISSSVPLSPPLTPDFNGDKVVDMTDFFMFADHFGKPVITDEDRRFDLAPDGKIDFLDYFLLTDAIGGE